MKNMIHRIKDWYITVIGRYFRTFKFADKRDRETRYYCSVPDLCDVSSEEIETMRRIFNRTARKYSLNTIAA